MVITCSSLPWGFGFMEEAFLEAATRRAAATLGTKQLTLIGGRAEGARQSALGPAPLPAAPARVPRSGRARAAEDHRASRRREPASEGASGVCVSGVSVCAGACTSYWMEETQTLVVPERHHMGF